MGYPRSGHSLVGALLDAHPHAIVAHELDAISKLQQGATQTQLYQAIVDHAQAFRAGGSKWMGYSYQIAGTEQGWSDQLTHIGDKRGGTTAKHLEHDWQELDEILSWGVNLKVIHVTRNPFDCISTAIKKREAKQGRHFTPSDVKRKADQFFRKAKAIDHLIQAKKFDIYTLQHEAIMSDFSREMRHLLDFLGLPPLPDYLAACEQAVWSNPHKSRHESPHWSDDNRAYVMQRMPEFSFFSAYSFDQ